MLAAIFICIDPLEAIVETICRQACKGVLHTSYPCSYRGKCRDRWIPPLSVSLKGRIGYAGEHLLWQWGYQLRKRKALGQMLCSAADDGQADDL